jgi:hypothetical protein
MDSFRPITNFSRQHVSAKAREVCSLIRNDWPESSLSRDRSFASYDAKLEYTSVSFSKISMFGYAKRLLLSKYFAKVA